MPHPLSPHAVGKLYAEKALAEFRRKFALDAIIYRIGNPYGERQGGSRSFGIVPALAKAAYDQTAAVLYGDTVRDYIYVGDVARIIAETFDRPHAHLTYNLGSGQGTRLSALVRLIEIASGNPIAVQQCTRRPFDVERIVLDTKRITDEFHIMPQTPLTEGLRRTYDAYRAERDQEIISLPIRPRPVQIRNLSFSFGLERPVHKTRG
jgi:UDP-glucose 4-epimerase